ncbi:ATP-binding protein, partial [bacterium]|nr:ATP-binding protein [bacterium]
EKEKERILKEFFDLILFKDIVERHNLKNISLAKFLLSFLTQNFSKEISINKISNFFKSQGKKFGKNTLYDYMDKIQDSVAVFFLPRFSKKIYVRESWPKKIYLSDTGLSKLVKFSPDFGKLMENAIFLEFLRDQNKCPLKEIYYLKTSEKKEIDFLIKEGIEIKELIQSSYQIEDFEVKKREIESLITASKHLKCNDLKIITWDKEGEEKIEGRTIRFIPLWKWLLKL